MRRILIAAAFVFAALTAKSAVADSWWPISVWSWDTPFSVDGARTKFNYAPIENSSKKWRICASIPHLKDAYWLGVNYGLVDEANRLNVSLEVIEAGGYGNLDRQKAQIRDCLGKNPDALIFSAVDFDGLNPVLAEAQAAGIPVIDLVNGTSFEAVTAKSAADYYDNGFAAGEFLKDLHKDQDDEATVIWFPGPDGAGWVSRGDKGFNDAIAGSNIKILATGYGDTGKKTQAQLIEDALKDHPEVDYIVGTTVSAEAAVDIVRRRGLREKTKVLAYYFGPGVHRGLKRGTILAAPSDLQVLQARIALDQAVRILEGEPYKKHVGPIVEVTSRETLRDMDLTSSLPPKGFKATFNVN